MIQNIRVSKGEEGEAEVGGTNFGLFQPFQILVLHREPISAVDVISASSLRTRCLPLGCSLIIRN